MRVGLLGGSFNPAHEGHRHVAELALRRLRLDQVWLLVSPGNPLKSDDGMAPLADRLAAAARIGDGRRVVATGIEAALRYTLYRRYLAGLVAPVPSGAVRLDHGGGYPGAVSALASLDGYRRAACRSWCCRGHVIPIGRLRDRPRIGYGQRAGQSGKPRLLPGAAPGWVFLPGRQTAVSATAIRQAAEGTVL